MSRGRKWLITFGVIMILLGIAAIALPLVAGLTVALVLGWLLVIGGVFQVIHAFRSQGAGPALWELLIGIVYIGAGATLLFYPLEGVLTLTIVLAVLLIVAGVFELLLAWRMRPALRWGWMLANGLLSLLLGVIIWAGLPGTAAWVLGLIVGIKLLSNGTMLIVAASAARQA